MTTKHTPGPWTAVKVSYKSGRQSAEAFSVVMAESPEDGRRRVADCRDEDVWKPEEDEANARLIATAPEMLVALTEVRKWLDLSGTMPDRIDALVRAAIAAATGGES